MPTKIECMDMVWRSVPKYPQYRVDVFGSIIGPSGKLLQYQYKGSGHAYITVGPRHSRKNLYVHHAVLTAFRGKKPQRMEARHLNGNASDNRLTNLAWGTRYEQRDDDKRNQVIRRPKNLTLNTESVITIRQLYGSASSRFVGELFGVSHTTIQKIWREERWQILEPQ